MSKCLPVGAVAATALFAGAGSAAAATPVTITATGTKLVRVQPSNRRSNASITAAVAAAHKAGIAGALADARSEAGREAGAAGLTLGALVAISDQSNNGGFYGPFSGPGVFYGPFGVNRYCGFERRAVIRTVTRNGKRVRRVVRLRKVYRCVVPPYESTTLTVTYNAA